MLSNIRIVLVETSHPGNIGAAARAMKNMGLSNLALVNPKIFPSAEATSRASGADNILASATVYSSLKDALEPCELVLGASARIRHLGWSEVGPKKGCDLIIGAAKTAQVAVVFGRENSGLTNEELELCHHLLHIPTNPDFSSLNVASAVQVLSYEIYSAVIGEQIIESPEVEDRAATSQEFEGFFDHLLKTLEKTDFLELYKTKRLQQRIRRIFYRSELNRTEVNILRGILTAVNNKIDGIKKR
ncbi:MAG: tRNA (cytosine(32)/uridine(32)-2'-O)-methyltransferase TrmJ [Cycloclasticus sp. symbiont of Bathymodiolus heckerae]|nr:MAG: tRNA (cytosine(32)/uridine(32)-2'-O)-methyltransferase TrmJ [Cycloclasticus sp. symbiont of Bathymodiolus heckerae]